MKRRLMSFVLAAVMVMTMLPWMATTVEAAKLETAPYANVDYDCSESVQCGTIRYISQITSSNYFYSEYWGDWVTKRIPNIYYGPGNECGTASLSMALSYVGINKLPKDILNAGNGVTNWDLWEAKLQYPSSISAGLDNYINGNGKYSPILIHLNYGATGNGHYVIITGKISDNVWQIIDPATDEPSTLTINGASTVYQGYSNKIDEIMQFYNAGASIKSNYLSKCSSITPTLAQVTGKSGNLKALPCSIETDPESITYHTLKGKTFIVDGFCTNSAGNLWYRTSCDCGCGAETAWVYSGDIKVDKVLYDIKLSDDAVYPTELVQDNGCNLKGTITTSHRLKEVTISVFKDALFVTEPIYTGADEIDLKQSYSISYGLDNKIKFSELDPGKYIFEICAVEQIEDPTIQACTTKTHVLLREKLTVSPRNSSSDTLSLSGETYPTSLSVGQWFVLQGTVTSASSKITSVTAGVFNSSGKMVTGKTVAPNAKSYNIHDLDNDVLLDSLSAGTYSYIIRATNASGEKELLNKTFTVGGGSSGSGSTISASGRYSVTNTKNITGQDIVATARQWANEGATYWSHYEPWLPSIYWRTGYTYSGQQSFDCSGFVSRVLNDCGLRSGNYTPPYGDCILSQQYGSGFISIQIEDLVSYGTDITDAVKQAKNGDYSGLQPGDLIAWTSGSLGRHVIIYAGMKNGTPWTVEFTGSGYRDRAMPTEYQSAFQFGARLVSDAGAACSEHTKGEFLFYEGAHPHYNYYTCATCGEKFSDWSTTALSDCDTCSPTCLNHTKGSFAYCEVDTHPHYNWYKCTECGKEFQNDTTQKVDNCKDCKEVGVVNCVRTFSFPDRTFPIYDRAAGIVAANVNWKNYIAICDQYVQLSDGTIRYRIAEGPKGSVGLWFSKVTGIEEIDAVHQFGATTYDDTHPHLAQKVCPCGYVETWIPDNYHDPACKVCNTTEATPSDFAVSDVSPEQWYYNAVQYVMRNGIMSGYNATTFGPNDNLSRAMVVQVLYNKEGQPAISGKHKFPDVPSSQWYNNAVTWGSQHGVVGGYGDGRFGPDDSVTLEQVAVILWNYSKNPAGTGSLSGIKGQYSDWAANALSWCAGKGILDNVPYSNATEEATRAQTAQMLKNYLDQ